MQGLLALYASIGLIAGVAQIAYFAVAFGVGGMLYARGRRNGEWTQWLLGLHLILSMGIGYLLACTGTVSVEFGAPLPRIALCWILGVGYAATISGLTATLHFTRQIFRPGRGVAFAYAFASGALMWIGWLGYLLTGDVAQGRFEGTPYWVMAWGMFATNMWVAFEPLLYHTRLRRRARLGLADPLVADRMLLWGAGSLARASLVFAGPIASAFLAGRTEAERLSLGAGVLVVATLLGLVTSASYWLAFQPPRVYLRWVEERAARQRATT
jgi:hypothetical protein